MERRLEIDGLRGMMMVWMTLMHLPTRMSIFANQPFGFVSSAEGFVFLSALVTGMTYTRLADRSGFRAMTARVLQRSLLLYGCHCLLLAFAFFVAAPIVAQGGYPGVSNLLSFFFGVGPQRASLDAALLLYRPPLLDILPMYILFLAFTPLALYAGSRWGWQYPLSGAVSLWLLAQFGWRQIAYHGLSALGSPVPLREMGAFDVWAWQFLWFLGIWMGALWARGELPATDWARRLLVPAAAIAVVLFLLRHASGHGWHLGTAAILIDKWHLGPIRLLDMFVVAALLVRFPAVARVFAVRPLILLGQASLYVFSVQVVACFIGLIMMGEARRVTGIPALLLLFGTLAALWITARIASSSKQRSARVRPALQPAR